MQPIDLIPVPDAVPVAWGWFQVLLTVTFVLHVIFMNFMLGGSVIALIACLHGGDRSGVAGWLGGKLPFSVAFAVNAGVAPLLFVQVLYGHFVYSSSVMMAAAWFAIIPLLIVAYYGMYLFNYKFRTSCRRRPQRAGPGRVGDRDHAVHRVPVHQQLDPLGHAREAGPPTSPMSRRDVSGTCPSRPSGRAICTWCWASDRGGGPRPGRLRADASRAGPRHGREGPDRTRHGLVQMGHPGARWGWASGG